MLAAIAVAAMVGAAQAPETPVTSAGPINLLDAPGGLPRFVQRPTGQEFADVYPHAAANLGVGGRALLHCEVAARDGRLAKCRVIREAPVDAGFGGAALGLARFFRVDPQSDAATRGELDLPIGFATSASADEQLTAGPWLEAPTFADIGAAYPDIGGGVTGQVVLHCALERDGRLKACKSIYMQPTDREFDQAALKLSHLFRMKIDQAALNSHQPLAANVLVRIAAPFGAEYKQRRIADPVWLASPSAAHLAELFPAQAASKSVTEGVGMADCTVGVDGALTACQPSGEGDPQKLGFSEAAIKAAGGMRMAPWTDDGGPVDGAQVRVPIRFTSVAQ